MTIPQHLRRLIPHRHSLVRIRFPCLQTIHTHGNSPCSTGTFRSIPNPHHHSHTRPLRPPPRSHWLWILLQKLPCHLTRLHQLLGHRPSSRFRSHLPLPPTLTHRPTIIASMPTHLPLHDTRTTARPPSGWDSPRRLPVGSSHITRELHSHQPSRRATPS